MNNDMKIKNWISEIKVRSKTLLSFMPQLRFLTAFEMTATAVMSGGVGRLRLLSAVEVAARLHQYPLLSVVIYRERETSQTQRS